MAYRESDIQRKIQTEKRTYRERDKQRKGHTEKVTERSDIEIK
jgi:hypothetical protein